MTVTEQHFT